MGETEVINELRRLGDVITELQNSNANLAGVIAELQASNTSLSAQLTQNTLTAQRLIEVQTRALDERDRANLPLPYDDFTLPMLSFAGVADSGSLVLDWTDADWGAGLSFYISSFTFFLDPAVPLDFLTEFEDLVFFRVWDAVAPPNTEIFFLYTFTPKDAGPSAFVWRGYTFNLPQLRKVLPTQAIEVELYNWSGSVLDVDAYISGIARAD